MVCPNCGSHISILHLHSQTVIHCSSCGGSMFEPNGINRLGLSDAKKLAQLAKKPYVSGKIKICPYDGKEMKRVSEQSIPDFVTLLSCPECKRVWGYPQDIIDFKVAQQSTINYYQAWHKPLPALRSVLVMSIMLFIGITSFYSLYRHATSNSSQTRAQDITKTVRFVPSGDAVMMYFTTEYPCKSEVLFTSPIGLVTVHKIAVDPATLHTAVFTQYPFNGTYSIRIRIIDQNSTNISSSIPYGPQ